jgi:hypothetical protein
VPNPNSAMVVDQGLSVNILGLGLFMQGVAIIVAGITECGGGGGGG